MKLQIESTVIIKEVITEKGSIEARLWYGTTPDGIKVDVWVAGIMVPNATTEQERKFAEELEKIKPLF